VSAIAEAIERYLRSGEYDIDHPQWPGQNIMEKSRNGHDEHLRALVAEVKRRSQGRTHAPVPQLDLASWTRRKLTPMVHGFFPDAERETVLRLFEKSVVFLTSDNMEGVLLGQMWLRSAWDLANLYLGSVDAELLGPEAPSLLGLSQETTCYVTPEYFQDRGRIEDFVIHEAAHVFHNCKRRTAGLPHTRTKEWLLLLEFSKRETFAYSCEAYGWIVERSSSKAERLALAERFATHGFGQCDESMDPSEVADIVQEACHARNGWKVILGHCAPERRSTRRSSAVMGIVE
jgi:hypothetical protein